MAFAASAAGNLAGGTHHAYRAEGSGFCVFNDLAIAEKDRLFLWPRGETGRRPDDHPSLAELGL